jgi:hypothetical protein
MTKGELYLLDKEVDSIIARLEFLDIDNYFEAQEADVLHDRLDEIVAMLKAEDKPNLYIVKG